MITTTQILDAANLVCIDAYKEEVICSAKAIRESNDIPLKKASVTLAKIYIHERIKSARNKASIVISEGLRSDSQALHDRYADYSESITTAYKILKAIHGHICPFENFFSFYRLLRICEWPTYTFDNLTILDIEALGSMPIDEFNRLVESPLNWIGACDD